MDNLRILLAFAALLALALFYVRLGLSASLAPLCAVGTVALWLSLAGALGFLRAGGWLLYLFCAGCAVFLLWQGIARKKQPPRPGFGFWFFALGGLGFMVLLWLRQPLFAGWDEFSLWGTAAKLMKLNDELYTTAPVGWIWTPTQKPAYIVFGYFFQFFGTAFAEWQTYVACDIFLLALLASLFAPFDKKLENHWNAALPLAVLALLIPYVFQHYQQAHAVSAVYMDALGDIPLGLCFAAVFACWYGAPSRRRLSAMAPVAVALALLTMSKDIGFSLALVAAGTVAADYLLAETAPGVGTKSPDERLAAPKQGAGASNTGTPAADMTGMAAPAVVSKDISSTGGARAAGKSAPPDPAPALTKKRRFGGFALRLALGLAAVLAPFAAWEAYTGAISGGNRLDSAVTEGGVGLLQAPFRLAQEVLSPDKTDFFNQITGSMTQFFFTSRGNMLGSGLLLALLVFGLLGLSCLLYKSRAHRRRCVLFGVLSTLGFAAYYYLVVLTSYLYIFRPEQALAFESYDRYVYPYYIGWLLGAVVLLCAGLASAQGRWVPVGKLALLGLAAAVFLRVGLLIPPHYTVLGVHPDEFSERREFNAHVDSLKPLLDPAGRTFLVKSGDNGIGWFMYCHQLLPWQLDYSFGGVLEQRDRQPDGTVQRRPVTPEELVAHLLESGCTTVYIDFADYDFIQTYGALFSDGLAAYQNGRASLYTVRPGGGGVVLEPVYGESVE